jgi:serine/threonine protein kinase
MITWKNIFLHLQLQNTVVAVKRFHAGNPSSVVNSRQEIDNILIDNDSPQHLSAVGKWVLTDFGISAFKETDEKEGKNYVTVRDYVEQKQNLTLNTHARREAGAYQPPEMERLSQAADGSSNTPLQRVVGRRSDIWSFGCIFAEVVAFSSGRRAAVSDFRDARRGTHNDDYFYTYRQLSSSNLSPGVSGHTPELRPEMVAWLMNMPDDLATPTKAHGVLKCSVAKVFDIMKIDQRPGAEEVRQAMEHLTSHLHPYNLHLHDLQLHIPHLDKPRLHSLRIRKLHLRSPPLRKTLRQPHRCHLKSSYELTPLMRGP